MKYIFGFVAVILLVILTFVLIWRGFTGGDNPTEQPAPLSDYTYTTVAMRYTEDGAVNPESQHRAIRITVSRSESRIEVLEGYNRSLVKSKSYPSNQEAYATFLRALDLLGYTEGIDNPELADDRGYCPDGRRYIYEIVDGTDVLQRYWGSSCSKKQGTFLGNGADTRDLFEAQIVDFRDFTRGVKLR